MWILLLIGLLTGLPIPIIGNEMDSGKINLQFDLFISDYILSVSSSFIIPILSAWNNDDDYKLV